MIDLNQEVEIVLGNKKQEHYLSKGYNLDSLKNKRGSIPKGTIIKVKLKDVTLGSHVEINYTCDYCKEIGKENYNLYDKQKKNTTVNKDACPKCKDKKRIESNIIKFGRRNPRMPTLEQIDKEFSKNGYILISNKYIKNDSKLEFICKSHMENGIQLGTYTNVKSGFEVCEYCAKEKLKGENHYNWQGGITSLSRTIRDKSIKEWKRDSSKNCEYKCVLTNARMEHIHHLKSFYLILQEALEKEDLPIHKEIGSYKICEMERIKSTCLKLHYKYGLGVCLTKPMHNLFHLSFGSKNNTPEQFFKFVKGLKSGQYDNYLIEHNIVLNINESLLSNNYPNKLNLFI